MMCKTFLCTLVALNFIVLFRCQSFQEKETAAKKKLFTPSESLIKDENTFAPTVLLALFVRNKEHALPYVLNSLYNLHYPKNRLLMR